MVFSFIVAMLETTLKSTPNASLTKPGVPQDKETHGFDSGVWSKIYALIGENLAVGDGSDDDIEDVIDSR
jgi:hypothetical protein